MDGHIDAPSQDAIEQLQDLLSRQQDAFNLDGFPTAEVRLDRLDRLRHAVLSNEDRIIQSINADFGQRSTIETRLAELNQIYSSIHHAKKMLHRWMKPRRVRATPMLLPARGKVVPQPLGSVGVIAPWNYPLQLALVPLAGILAAGNRAILKPSELAPSLSALMAEIIDAAFTEEEVAVVLGEADVAAAMAALPFDHLIFTGSTAVGRLVSQAAAKNLTPLTLELGGKSPVILDESSNLDLAVKRIVRAKLFNAGQTCIAPDYLMVPAQLQSVVVDKVLAAAAKMYPSLRDNPDATAIVNDRHYARLNGLLEDAKAKGATVKVATSNGARTYERMMPLSVVTDTQDDMSVMEEEIFGPILPVLPYETLDAALAYVRARPRPLSLYWFGKNAAGKDKVVNQALAGGITINDCLLHNAHENLPFGGVGDSGTGAYHGQWGFDRFSHLKAVLLQPHMAVGFDKFTPPFDTLAMRMLGFVNWFTKRG